MKKSLFGYNISEADITLNALREENESLNASIIALKTQIKNSASEENGKISLLENVNMKNKEALKNAADEKRSLLSQIAVLSKDVEELRKENETLRAEMAAGAQAVEVRAADKGLGIDAETITGNMEASVAETSREAVKAPSQTTTSTFHRQLQHPASNQQPVSPVIFSAKASVPSKQRHKLKNVPGSGSEGQQGKFVSAVLKDIAGVSKKITREGQNIAKSIKRTPPK
jgi:cell division protein FtsB